MDPNFIMAAVYLGAVLLVVPLAVRVGLGSVLGYLAAGLMIGPFALNLVGAHGKEVMHFAEFGVVMRPMLRAVASSHMRELFTAASLLLVVGVTLLMMAVGLSPALGTFLAGVVLANSEYRHELESDIEPFKGLLLGLFFMSVGASLDLGLVAADPAWTLGLVAAVVAAKLAVLTGLGYSFGLRGADLAQFSASLGQVGEFAFVVFGFAAAIGVLPAELALLFTAVTALSMAASPLIIALTDRVIAARRPAITAAAPDEAGPSDDGHAVIIAGYGRFGQVAGRFLRANQIGTTVLDVDPEQLDIVRRFGHQAHYGDASRIDLLHAAGAHRAKVLIIAVDDHDKALQIAHTAHKHFPNLAILARARGRTEAYDLLEAEVEGVYRETFDTALRTGVDAMRLLGVPPHHAQRLSAVFRAHDEQSVRELAPHRTDRDHLVRTSKERARELERALQADAEDAAQLADGAWDDSPRRGAATAR